MLQKILVTHFSKQIYLRVTKKLINSFIHLRSISSTFEASDFPSSEIRWTCDGYASFPAQWSPSNGLKSSTLYQQLERGVRAPFYGKLEKQLPRAGEVEIFTWIMRSEQNIKEEINYHLRRPTDLSPIALALKLHDWGGGGSMMFSLKKQFLLRKPV